MDVWKTDVKPSMVIKKMWFFFVELGRIGSSVNAVKRMLQSFKFQSKSLKS